MVLNKTYRTHPCTKLDKYPFNFKFLVLSCKIMGYLPIFEGMKPFNIALNTTYFIFMDFLFGHMVLLCGADLIYSWDGNFFTASVKMINFLVYLCGLFIEIVFQFQTSKLAELFNYIQNNFRYRSACGLTIVTAQGSEYIVRKVVIVLSCGTLLASLQWVYTPLMLLYTDGTRTLPYNVRYPLDVQPLPLYVLVFLLQIVAQCFAAFIYSTIGSLYVTLSILVRVQYSIVWCSTRNVCFTGALHAGVSRDELITLFSEELDISDIYSDECFARSDLKKLDAKLSEVKYSTETGIDFSPQEDLIMEAIADCVEHQQIIQKFLKMQQQYFSLSLSIEFFALIIDLAVSLYASSVKFQLKTFLYVIASSTHMFLFCFCGSMVKHESGFASEAAYGAAWWSGNRRVARAIIILSSGTRPEILTAGPFFDLNLSNFVSAIKMSFSFYTLLHHLKE